MAKGPENKGVLFVTYLLMFALIGVLPTLLLYRFGGWSCVAIFFGYQLLTGAIRVGARVVAGEDG